MMHNIHECAIFLFFRSELKLLKQRHQSLKSGNSHRQYRFLTPGPASGRKRGGRKDNSSTWMSMGPMKFRSWIQEQAGPGSEAPRRWFALQRPRALAGGLVFSTYHLSPFINKHLPQEWHISKAIPSSLALASSPSPGQGAMYDKCWATSYAVSLSLCLFSQLN